MSALASADFLPRRPDYLCRPQSGNGGKKWRVAVGRGPEFVDVDDLKLDLLALLRDTRQLVLELVDFLLNTRDT